MKEKIIKRLKRDLKVKTMSILAAEIGLSYGTLWRMVHGDNKTRLQYWEKTERFYKKAS